jgi:hypothetical protein
MPAVAWKDRPFRLSKGVDFHDLAAVRFEYEAISDQQEIASWVITCQQPQTPVLDRSQMRTGRDALRS